MKNFLSFAIVFIVITATNAQNVGIGTATPTAMLDVNSLVGFTSKFNSSNNQMYVGFFENNNLRGYVGSFSGAAEDFDIGTSSSNTIGKLHLTTLATPRLTINSTGNVGIGTTTPLEKMDVSGSIRMTGELKPNGVAGTSGQVLTSNGNGTMQWSSLTSTNGTSSGNGGWGDCSIYNIDSYYPAANPDGQPEDQFGYKVAISGPYAIVGAPFDNEGGFGGTGSATVFKYNSTTGAWESQGKLIIPNPAGAELFGRAVAISGDYAIVGAPTDDEGGFISTGSATIFKRNTGTGVWESQGKLTNPNPANSDLFGHSVAISGDYAIVGAMYDDENGFNETGSATIFKRNAGTGVWESQGKLVNPNAAIWDYFGSSVGISGDYAIIGANEDDENGLLDNGSVTIFKRNAGTGIWESQGKLTNPFAANSDLFGWSVAISGDYVIVGAYDDDENGINNCGSVTIFKRNTVSGVWASQGKYINPNAAADDHFGSSVSITGDYAIAGAIAEAESGNLNVGTATIFKRNETNWFTHQKFSYPNPFANSLFGCSVAIEGSSNRFVAGAQGYNANRGAAFFGKAK